MRMILVVIGILLALALHQVTSFDCIGTCYSGRLLPEPQNIFHGKHLKGFSYKNITTDDPKECYSSCAKDCRCKACQMKDVRCELLDEDMTSKTNSFTVVTGYVYYDVRQTNFQGKSHMIPPGVCYNGCCRSQPCVNGGTCIEHCQSPKEKFSCNCTIGFYGKLCEHIATTCLEMINHSGNPPPDGIYEFRRPDNNNTINLYCSFAIPNQAWTLIESFSLANKDWFKVKPFFIGESYRQNQPNWDKFRISLSRMQYIKSSSTLFRATCDFPNRDGKLTPDFLLGNLSDIDIISLNFDGCKKYKVVNIRGHECQDCQAFTVQGATHSNHYHLDVTWGRCDFNPPFLVKNVDSFGYYEVTESVSKCTATAQSTTQWWLGAEK